MRDLRLVNLALLSKWRCSLLVGDSSLRRDIMVARYRGFSISSPSGGWAKGFQTSSYWWKDTSLLGIKKDCRSYWFSNGITSKVALVYHTSFWKDPWLGNTNLIS